MGQNISWTSNDSKKRFKLVIVENCVREREGGRRRYLCFVYHEYNLLQRNKFMLTTGTMVMC